MSQCRVKCCGAGKGDEWESGRQQLAEIAMEPQTNPGDFAKVTQASVSRKLKPLCVIQGADHRSVKCSNWQEVALDLFYLNLLFVCKY